MEYSYNNGMNNMAASHEVKPSENFFMGLIGALGGAVIGAASIILLGQMGYVAAISGLILAFCTLKGYALLGKGMSTKGAILCVILMLVTPVAAYYLSSVISVYRELEPWGATFKDAWVLTAEALEYSDVRSEFFKDLGMLYLFVVIGGISLIVNAFKK